ncbi:unnamed protein product [Rotaria sp. Silwood2]|nr:unnamed protein product [Rotaria sp. Silwood2]CAF3925735.1 unnamed protein product [Rotaria sp. Silwood2]
MPIGTGKVKVKKISIQQLSSNLASTTEVTNLNIADDNIETKYKPLSTDLNENKININPIRIILAKGQQLLTNFEEKYLLDNMLKTLNKDIEIILETKNLFNSTNELCFTIINIYNKFRLNILFRFEIFSNKNFD